VTNEKARDAALKSQTARINGGDMSDVRMLDVYLPGCFRQRVGHVDQDDVLLVEACRAPRRRGPCPGPRTPFHSKGAFSPGDTMYARRI
jgi:hypothetical protein